jgi:hypothetical protein
MCQNYTNTNLQWPNLQRQENQENPQLAQHSYRQEPVAVLAFLHSPHTNAGMKQYECGRTQPLLRMGHDHRKTSGQNLKG